MIQEKKCRASGPAINHPSCGKMLQVEYRRYGMCPTCYASWIMGTEAGRIKLAKATLKATKPRMDLEKLALDRKDRNQISNLLVNVRMKCHEYIRRRDYGKPCISCNVPWSDDFHACHLYKAELYSSLKFNEFNIHGGCRKCNLFMEGNESGYRVGLLNRYGQEYLTRLDLMAQNDKKQDFKWNRLELEENRKHFSGKIKELKNQTIEIK